MTLATTLAEKLTALGIDVELFPTIDIQATPLQKELLTAISALNTFDIGIWVSQAAVTYVAPLINQHWHNPTSIGIQWAAIGKGTANALLEHGLQPVIVPNPPYESETLLALAEFQSVPDKKILILRGNGGRNLLTEVLQQRGAIVQTVETYQRTLPKVDMVERLRQWHHTSIDVIVTTSAESLQNLVLLVGADISWLKNIHLVVVGKRMLELAHQLDFKKILVANGADDAAILEVLQRFKEEGV